MGNNIPVNESLGLYTLDMLRGHQIYRTSHGEVVPGVTTIVGDTVNKPYLVPWANKLGLQGIDSSKSRDHAATVGTVAHGRIESWLRGMVFDQSNIAPDIFSKSTNSFDRFRKWWEREGYTVEFTERQLVSDALRCGGTLDIGARTPAGKLDQIDIKTSKSVYKEMKIQVAGGYSLLWKENNPEPFDRIKIVRIGKEEDDTIEPVEITDAAEHCENAFRTAVAHYYALQKVR